MRKFILLLILFISLVSKLSAFEDGSPIDLYSLMDPGNDKEVVILCYHYDEEAVCFYKIDLETDKIHENITDMTLKYTNKSSIDGKSGRFAVNYDSLLYIYNYHSGEMLLKTVIDVINDTNCIYSLSYGGESLFVFNRATLKLTVIDTKTGSTSEELFLGEIPSSNPDAFILPEKEQVVIRRADSLEYWSVKDGMQSGSVHLSPKAFYVRFCDGGKHLSYFLKPDTFHLMDAANGDIIYKKKLQKSEIYRYFLSANMRYLLVDNCVYDIREDTFLFKTWPSLKWSSTSLNYVSSDLKIGIGCKSNYYNCFRGTSDPAPEQSYFIYDIADSSKISSIPPGFIEYPEKIVTNSDCSLASVWSRMDRSTLLVNVVDSSFVKYFQIEAFIHSFTPDSKYLTFTKSDTILFVNIETKKTDRELFTDMDTITGIIFDSTRNFMIAYNNDLIEVFNTGDYSLRNKTDLVSKGMNLGKIVISPKGEVNYFTKGKSAFHFDPSTGSSTARPVAGIPQAPDFNDLTNDGRYALFWNNADSVVSVYDIEEQKTIYGVRIDSFKYNFINNSVITGFLGSHKAIWVFYSEYYIDLKGLFGYNLETGMKINIVGQHGYFETPGITMHIDGKHYFSARCPYRYSLEAIPDELITAVPEETKNGSSAFAYPNPAEHIITISNEKLSENASVLLFDNFGRRIDNGKYNFLIDESKISLDVSRLAQGQYIIQILNGTKTIYTRVMVVR